MKTDLFTLVQSINKKFNAEIVTFGASTVYREKIPFRSARINYMTYGGIPVGRATEFLGAEGSGKTTIALDIVGQAQRYAQEQWEEELQRHTARVNALTVSGTATHLRAAKEAQQAFEDAGPRKVVYVDAENTLDQKWAKLQGVDTDALIVVRPEDQTAEQVLQLILDFIDTEQVALLVLDSVPSLVPKQIYEETLDKKSYGGASGPLSVFCAKVSAKLNRTKTTLVLINQVREDFDNPYNAYNTPGGRALKHLYGLRIFCRKGKFIGEDNEELLNSAEAPFGNLVDLVIVKSKVCPPDRRVGQYTIRYDTGMDVYNDLLSMAQFYGFIRQAGAWYTIVDVDTGALKQGEDGKELRFQGKKALLTYVREHTALFDELQEQVLHNSTVDV